MARVYSDEDEILIDFRRLTRRICREKNLQLKELEKEVGASPGAFSQIRPTTEHHYRMFKKLFRYYPLALFDDPVSDEDFWHHIYLSVHGRVTDEDKRSATYEKARELAQSLLRKEQETVIHPDNSSPKPRRKKKAVTRS